MKNEEGHPSNYGIDKQGLKNTGTVYWNLFPPEIVEQAIIRNEGQIAHLGALVVRTGKHTGRSPNDKFFVQYEDENDRIINWGKVNKPISPENFEKLWLKARAYLQGKDLFVQDLQAGAHPSYQLPLRIITEKAWASLFARNLFIRVPLEKLTNHVPEFTIFHLPELKADAAEDGLNSDTFIVANLTKKIILIGGTGYAGEIKKSIFTILNHILPTKGVLSMHCSANVGQAGDVALFFGLSGTGKTTLSSDPERRLIGDDEHGWGADGVFNFEGGCYAKIIRLNPKYEPMIYDAVHRFGTLIENAVLDPISRRVDFDNDSVTENTRAAYPIDFIDNFVDSGIGTHPSNIFFLTADAFGVLPPIAKLTKEQALYYFLAGYTSKLAGTEVGLGQEPEATFSSCFGAPFMPLKPSVYADLLGQKIEKHHVKVWLINTGWTGGPFGVGKRFSLPYTRAMIQAVLTGQLDEIPMRQELYFKLWVPSACPGVPQEVLDARQTWQDVSEYERQAKVLVERFMKNFKQFEGMVSPGIINAGPTL